jgi:hypothetical protein
MAVGEIQKSPVASVTGAAQKDEVRAALFARARVLGEKIQGAAIDPGRRRVVGQIAARLPGRARVGTMQEVDDAMVHAPLLAPPLARDDRHHREQAAVVQPHQPRPLDTVFRIGIVVDDGVILRQRSRGRQRGARARRHQRGEQEGARPRQAKWVHDRECYAMMHESARPR